MSLQSSLYDQYPRSVWLEINLAKFRKNIEIIKEQAATRVLVVVKANAYGHGLIECGLAAEQAGATMLGAATAGETALLKAAGIKIPILRMTAYGTDEIEPMINDDTHLFAWTKEHIEHASAAAQKLNKTANLHLKIDTGMGRGGCFAEDARQIAALMQATNKVELIGLCSHFHTADGENTDSTAAQMQKFEHALTTINDMGITPAYIHLANSPGLIRFPDARYNMVRSGVITYGLFYERGFDLFDGMEAISEWKARIVSIKTLPPNHGVSYGTKYTTTRAEKVAVIPVGYADGFHRHPDHVNEVLVQGRRLKVLGRVCMDQCMISIPDDMDVSVGEEVILMGSQGNERIDSLDLADKWGTNNYDVVAGISARVPRKYI